MRVIDGLTLMLSEACNMRCKYCFEQTNGYKNKHMSEKVIKKSLEIALSKDNKSEELIISLFGGEPTVNAKGLIQIIKSMKEIDFSHIPNVYLNITSNMYVINKEFLEGLEWLAINKKVHVEYGASCVFDEKWHNHDRVDIEGKGTYQKVINNLIYGIEKYPNINWKTHTVISREMCKDFTLIVDKTLEFRRKYPQLYLQSFNLVSSESDENDTFDSYTKEEIRYLYEDYLKRDKTEFCETVYQDIYFPIVPSIHYLGKGEISVCRALKTEIMIMTDGTIYPCHKIAGQDDIIKKTFNLGNILNVKSKNNIVDKNHDFENIQDGKVHFESKIDNYDCTECNFNTICHSCIMALYTKEEQFKYKTKKECKRTMQIAELNLEYEKLRLIQEQNEKMEKLIYSIENMNNTLIVQTEAITLLLQKIESEINQ